MSIQTDHLDQMHQILDGAKLTKVDRDLRQLVVWHGGVTINVYAAGTLNEITCFSLSDELGEPRPREDVAQHIDEHFERERDRDY